MEAPDPSEQKTVVHDSRGEDEVMAASEKAGSVARALGVAGALILAFAAAVAIIAMVEISGLTPCYDANRDPDFTGTECFDGSSKRKLLTLLLGFPGAVLAAIGVVLLLAFVVRGRGLKPVGIAVGAGVVLFGLSLIVGATA